MKEAFDDASWVPHHVVMGWSAYVSFLGDDAEQRIEQCRQAWGELPPAVEIVGGELRPVWGSDGPVEALAARLAAD